jgi:hypothetical protein
MPLAIFSKGPVAENAAAINDQSINQQSFKSITTKSNFISHQYRPVSLSKVAQYWQSLARDTGPAMPSRSEILMIQTNSQKSR